MLLAMYREYGAQCEFDASASAFSGAWGTNLTISTFPSVSYPIYQVDGQVVYGPVTDEAKDYLKTMKDWLDEGILYKDFATRTSNFGTISDLLPVCSATITATPTRWPLPVPTSPIPTPPLLRCPMQCGRRAM